MPGSATPIFLSFYVTFMNSKSGLEINGWSYVLIFTVFARNQVDTVTAVTRQIASDIIKPTSNFTLKLIISYQIIFGDVTFFTGCYTTFTFLRFSRKFSSSIVLFCAKFWWIYKGKFSSYFHQCAILIDCFEWYCEC